MRWNILEVQTLLDIDTCVDTLMSQYMEHFRVFEIMGLELTKDKVEELKAAAKKQCLSMFLDNTKKVQFKIQILI